MNETALKIKVFPDPALRRRARPVAEVTEAQRDILSRMSQLMYEADGVGLAAPQVGISEEMIVLDAGSGLYKLINPKIIKREGTQAMEEGCLSVPGVCLKVKRARKIIVRALDEYATSFEIEACDFLACVLQHEIDHLKGKLILDYASFLQRLKIAKKLERLKESAESEKLSEPETKSCKLQL
jgi:peptide deformylase